MPTIEELLQAKQRLLATGILAQSAAQGVFAMRRSGIAAEAVVNAGRNVHALGIGRKMVGGQPTAEMAVRIYVVQKLDESLIAPIYRLPTEVNGVPTDIIESAPAVLACQDAPKAECRPVVGGVGAAHFAAGFGTLACLCRSTRDGEKDDVFALSCNHVFANLDAAEPNDELFQPCKGDQVGTALPKAFATLARTIAIVSDDVGVNLVDAAIGRVDLSHVEFKQEICGIGPIGAPADGTDSMPVVKYGRTTKLTNGIIDDAHYTHTFPHPRNGRTLTFHNQLRIRPVDPQKPFADFGDSGSLVLRDPDHAAVGLLFAKDPEANAYAVANRFETVMEKLQIALL